MADRRGKKQAFVNLLKMLNPKNAIIFSNTKKMVDELDAILRLEGYQCGALHGDMRQSQRKKVMTDMKNGKINILIASDVAARGIDIENIDYVINYDLPNNVEYFLHRIGRTARAGRKGTAVTIVNTKQQLSILKDFEKQTSSNISEIEVKVHGFAGGTKHFENSAPQKTAKNSARKSGERAGRNFAEKGKGRGKNTKRDLGQSFNRRKRNDERKKSESFDKGFKGKSTQNPKNNKRTKATRESDFETRKSPKKNKSFKTGSKFLPAKRNSRPSGKR